VLAQNSSYRGVGDMGQVRRMLMPTIIFKLHSYC